MVIRSKVVIKVNGKVPITLEGVQLCLNNAERLYNDSLNVSIPTKIALQEIGLEEISKAWNLIANYEKNIFENQPDLLENFLKTAHINLDKYNRNIQENEKSVKEFLNENVENSFLRPFDSETFKDHKSKIEFLSKFVKYMREVQLPLIIDSQDRTKLIGELVGRYIPKNYLTKKDARNQINAMLNINVDQLSDIVDLKERGLYVDIEGNALVSPISRPYEIEILGNLLVFLIALIKNEIVILTKTIDKSED